MRSKSKKAQEFDKGISSKGDKRAIDDESDSDGPPRKTSKTRAVKKGKNKVKMTELREEIKVNRKVVPTQAARLEVRESCHH